MSKIIPYFQKLISKMHKIPIAIHPLFLAVGIFMVLFGKGFIWLIYIVLAISHELAHLIVAKKLGYKLNKVRLMPFGAVLEAEEDEFLPKDEILIGLAGPLFNLILSFFIVALWWVKPEIYNLTIDFAVANLSLGLFNLVPIFPLDGGRILLAFLSRNGDRKTASKLMRVASGLFGLLLIFICFISLIFGFNLTIGIVGLMLLSSAFSKGNNLCYKRIIGLAQKRKKLEVGLPVKRLMMNENLAISKAYKKLSYAFFGEVIVVDDDFINKGIIYENQLCELIESNDLTLTLKEALIKLGCYNY